MQESAETSEICPRGQRLKRNLPVGQVYHTPNFATISAAKPQRSRTAKPTLKREKPPKTKEFSAQDLF